MTKVMFFAALFALSSPAFAQHDIWHGEAHGGDSWHGGHQDRGMHGGGTHRDWDRDERHHHGGVRIPFVYPGCDDRDDEC